MMKSMRNVSLNSVNSAQLKNEKNTCIFISVLFNQNRSKNAIHRGTLQSTINHRRFQKIIDHRI